MHTFQNIENSLNWKLVSQFFFLSRFSFTDTDDLQDSRGKKGTILYSTLRLAPAHEHSNIYLQLYFACRWLSHIFNHNAYVYQTATRWDLPPYWITIWLIDRWCNVCLLDDLILGLCYSNLTWETGGFGLTSTVTLVLQANRLTKCTSHRLIG